ncbi:MAG: HPr family phosphocarrier protein [Micrococcales bacterium]
MVQDVVTVGAAEGLHARPATEFAKACTGQSAVVKVSKPGFDSVRGDSVLSLMTLGAKQGDKLLIQVSGEGEETLLEQLKSIVCGPVSH